MSSVPKGRVFDIEESSPSLYIASSMFSPRAKFRGTTTVISSLEPSLFVSSLSSDSSVEIILRWTVLVLWIWFPLCEYFIPWVGFLFHCNDCTDSFVLPAPFKCMGRKDEFELATATIHRDRIIRINSFGECTWHIDVARWSRGWNISVLEMAVARMCSAVIRRWLETNVFMQQTHAAISDTVGNGRWWGASFRMKHRLSWSTFCRMVSLPIRRSSKVTAFFFFRKRSFPRNSKMSQSI